MEHMTPGRNTREYADGIFRFAQWVGRHRREINDFDLWKRRLERLAKSNLIAAEDAQALISGWRRTDDRMVELFVREGMLSLARMCKVPPEVIA
jgi:hypothetical protein